MRNMKWFLGNVCFFIFLFLMNSIASAREDQSTFADPRINAAYNDCRFSFNPPDSAVLLSNGEKFSYLREIYRGGWCVAKLDAPMAASLAVGDDAEYYRSIIVNIKRSRYLVGYERCAGEPNYDLCQENAIFKYEGFQKNDKGIWRKLTFVPQSGFGIGLEQSLSSVLDETIRNEDGFTVVAEWEHPYAFYKQPEKNILSLFVIRKAQFGYVTVGGDGAIAIPLGNTTESRAEAKALARQIVKVVQSIRMEDTN